MYKPKYNLKPFYVDQSLSEFSSLHCLFKFQIAIFNSFVKPVNSFISQLTNLSSL